MGVRRAAADASRRRVENVGTLAAGIAHDFRNLLGSVLAETELALANLDEGLSPRQELQTIQALALRASEICRELMDASRQESPRRESVDLSSLVSEMMELLRISISKTTKFETRLDPGLPAVLGDAPQLRRVAMNLIINASEAIGGRGIIRVATTSVTNGAGPAGRNHLPELTQGDYLRLEVSDTGRGMGHEELARIFEPSFTTKSAGRGLGLSLVREIVQAHGGAVRVASSPGCGATFHVFLPCAITAQACFSGYRGKHSPRQGIHRGGRKSCAGMS
jgi:signal transduction histidine kinase